MSHFRYKVEGSNQEPGYIVVTARGDLLDSIFVVIDVSTTTSEVAIISQGHETTMVGLNKSNHPQTPMDTRCDSSLVNVHVLMTKLPASAIRWGDAVIWCLPSELQALLILAEERVPKKQQYTLRYSDSPW